MDMILTDPEKYALTINEVLTDTYRNIIKMEEQMLRRVNKFQLSIGEYHALEAAAKLEPPDNTLSDIANALSVRRSSATVMMTKLEQKGFVRRIRDTVDKRSVFIELTDQGREANRLHHKFHMLMVKKLIRRFEGSEREILLRSLTHLRDFFRKNTTFDY